MKKYIKVLLSLVLCVCFMLAGCSKPLDMPSGEVNSNGGNVVSVGNYVYYANTFVDYSTLSDGDNTENSTQHNSIYRIKTDDFGFVTKNDDGLLENVEKVYSKIAGFNNSNMFVVGDYLYFTSPNIHKNSKGENQFGLTTLFKLKLDGTGLSEVFTTSNSQGKFFLVTETNPYMLVFDNSQILKIDLKNNSKKVLVNDVLDTVFPKQYGSLDTVYFTTALEESSLTGNYINKLSLTNGETTRIVRTDIKLVAYENGVLYYKKSVGGEYYYFSNTMKNGFDSGESPNPLTLIGENDENQVYSAFTPINNEHYVFMYDSKIMLDTSTTPLVSDENVNLELVYGDYVYYTTADGLFRISYKDKVVQKVANKTDIKSGTVEIAGEYCYFYAKVEGNTTDTYYAYRANNRIIENPSREPQVDCIASVLNEDIQ